MKKVLSRILAVTLIVVLFSAPSTAQAATNSVPVCYNVAEGVKDFIYTPDALDVSPNQDVWIDDNSDSGSFYVPAGKDFTFKLLLDNTEQHYYRIVIYKIGYGQCYDSQTISDRFPVVTIPRSSTDEKYFVTLKAYTNLKINSYISIISNH